MKKTLPYLVVDTNDNFHVLYSHAQTLEDAVHQAAGGDSSVEIYVPYPQHAAVQVQLDQISNLVADDRAYDTPGALMDAIRSVLSRPVVQLEVQKVPVLCTSHLDDYTRKALSNMGNQNPWAPCAEWEHGFFLYLDVLEDTLSPVPKCLTDLRDWRVSMAEKGVIDNSGWIRLDAAGDVNDLLPTYEWAKE